MEQIQGILDYIVDSFIQSWPYLLLSIPIAVAVQMSGASKYIRRAFSAKPILAIFLATFVGAFSPLCACTVIPVIAAMLIGGIPLAPVMSFWLASPSMDPEIFLLTVSSLGWNLAVWRLVSTLVLSLGGGLITHILTENGWLGDNIIRTRQSFQVKNYSQIFREGVQAIATRISGGKPILATSPAMNVEAAACSDPGCGVIETPVVQSTPISISAGIPLSLSQASLSETDACCGEPEPVAEACCGEPEPVAEACCGEPEPVAEACCGEPEPVAEACCGEPEPVAEACCGEAEPMVEACCGGPEPMVEACCDESEGADASMNPVEKPFKVRLAKETWAATTMVMKFMLLAWIIGGLIRVYVPEAWVTGILGYSNPWSIFTGAILGVPVYTSNLAAMSLVSGLLAQGMHPPAALSFLIAGPMTTLPAMSAVWGLVNRKVFAIYISFAMIGAVAFGYVYLFVLGI